MPAKRSSFPQDHAIDIYGDHYICIDALECECECNFCPRVKIRMLISDGQLCHICYMQKYEGEEHVCNA